MKDLQQKAFDFLADKDRNIEPSENLYATAEDGTEYSVDAFEILAEFAEEQVNSALQEAAEENKKLKSALEDAIIGLEWEIENTPELDHKADEEKLQEWKGIIESLQIKK